MTICMYGRPLSYIWVPSRELRYPFPKGTIESMMFPCHQVGYVIFPYLSLEGIYFDMFHPIREKVHENGFVYMIWVVLSDEQMSKR